MSTETTVCTIGAYHRPATLDDALRILRDVPGARPVAGGTDLLVHVRDGREGAPPALVSLRRVPELCGVTIEDGAVTIGALTTMSDIVADAELARLLPAVHVAAADFGGVQIRNAATIGGNLVNASPCANLPPALLVHGASVVLRALGGVRTVDLRDFIVGPGETCLRDGEVLAAVTIPRPLGGLRSTFRRTVRVAMDMALVSVAAAVAMDGGTIGAVRVAAGAVAPTPRRLAEVEELLRGAVPDEGLLRRAGELAAAGVAPISDVRASESYRRHMTGVHVRRALAELTAGGVDGDA